MGSPSTEIAGATISNGKYNAFGTLASLHDGTLLMVYREACEHVGDVGVVKMRTSGDGGRTWSSAETIASEAGVDLRNCAGGVTSTGRVIVFYARYDPGSSSFLSQGYIVSDDDGNAWSAFSPIPHASNIAYSPHGQMIETGNGTLLQTWYGDDGANYTSYVIASADNGGTWGLPAEIATSTSTKYTETSLAYLGDGHVVAMLRTNNGTTFSQALSSDNGISWTVQGLTSFDSWSTPSPPQLAVYQTTGGKQKIACYYVNRTALKMRVAYCSAEAALTGVAQWSTPTDLATVANGDSGYPGVVHPAGGATGVGWYYESESVGVANIVFFIAARGVSGGSSV